MISIYLKESMKKFQIMRSLEFARVCSSFQKIQNEFFSPLGVNITLTKEEWLHFRWKSLRLVTMHPKEVYHPWSIN